MGFLSKKSMLVSLLALSLAACASKPTVTGPLTIDIPSTCDGNVVPYVRTIDNTQPAVIFQAAACSDLDVDFKPDKSNGNEKHFTDKQKSKTNGHPAVKFKYDGKSLLGDGAYFYYTTPEIPPGKSTDGGGGGFIH
jgi:hypothetical protein